MALLGGQVLAVGGLILWGLTRSSGGVDGPSGTGIAAPIVTAVITAASVWISFGWVRARVAALLARPSPIGASPVGARPPELDRPAEVLAGMARTIRDALEVGGVQIETFPSPSGPHPPRPAVRGTWMAGATAVVGVAGDRWIEEPLTDAARVYGMVRVASGRREPRRRSESDLRRDLVRQAALAVSSCVLREEVESSRERLVLAREEERRRIRRDLHDGLGPSLAAVRLQLSALRRDLEPTDHRAATIDEICHSVGSATAEVRRVVEDLRPPLLDNCGLVEAIRNLPIVPATLALTVEAPSPLPHLPAAVEVALYRIAVEAVHNTVRHAAATRCTVELEVDGVHATLLVDDDGRGFEGADRPGVGTAAMEERASELGGTVSTEHPHDGGTVVRALLPLRTAAR